MIKPSTTVLLGAALFALGGCSSQSGPKFRNVSSYSEGMAAVQASSGKWGFVGERQQWLIEPRFDEVKAFQAGRAAAKQNGKWGFINKRGEWQ